MAANWIGKCNECDRWRTIHTTHRRATTIDNEGYPDKFVLSCDFCNKPIQRKCCASGCPSCGGSGMHPIPQPYTTQCNLCPDEAQTSVGGKPLCYGCEHEVMGYDHEENARLMTLYGE